MSEEEQETFQEILELERYIEQLRSQRSARPPANLTAEQMRIYSMTAFFHTASAEIADPRPEFGAQLYQRLLQQAQTEDNGPAPFQSDAETVGLQEIQRPTNLSAARKETADAGLPPVATSTVPFQGQQQIRRIYSGGSQPASTDEKKAKRRAVSRRTLLTGGTIAASLLAGAGIGAAIGNTLESQPGQQPPDLHPTIRGEAWHLVAPAEQLGQEPIRFSTNTITGYLIRQTGNGNEAITSPTPTTTSPAEQIIAFSAACTHLGCLVQWQNSTREFPCPCHGRTFDAAGNPVYSESQPHYMSLPRIETKIEGGNIYVKVPT